MVLVISFGDQLIEIGSSRIETLVVCEEFELIQRVTTSSDSLIFYNRLLSPRQSRGFVACVTSVFVRFWSKERPRNGIFGFDRARNKTIAKK